MRRFTTLPIIAVAFAVGCNTTTDPDRAGSEGLTPSFAAGSNETECIGTLPPGAYKNIVVPANEGCFIRDLRIKGDILVLENSALSIRGGTTVGGSIQANQSQYIVIINTDVTDNNSVKGDIQLTGLTEGTFICGVRVTHGDIYVASANGIVLIGGVQCNKGVGGGNIVEKGSLTVEDNFLAENPLEPTLVVGNNQVAQNLVVLRNLGAGAKSVALNTVGQTVQCLDNDAPFVGGPNTAQNAEGQCF